MFRVHGDVWRREAGTSREVHSNDPAVITGIIHPYYIGGLPLLRALAYPASRKSPVQDHGVDEWEEVEADMKSGNPRCRDRSLLQMWPSVASITVKRRYVRGAFTHRHLHGPDPASPSGETIYAP